MGKFRFFFLFLFNLLIGCSEVPLPEQSEGCSEDPASEQLVDGKLTVRGALVSTRFNSFEELRNVIQIEYSKGSSGADTVNYENTEVHLTHCSYGRKVVSKLTSGVNDNDFVAARDGPFWDRFRLLVKSPYGVIHRKELQIVYTLARRRPDLFGEGDPAFYDISAEIMGNISKQDSVSLSHKDLTSEKGYFNTINHITAQVFMTAIFSEKLADFIADSHERKNMPELITGNFTQEQIEDLETGPVDNYVDIINNEYGQELGKLLKKKYNISPKTQWTPDFLANFLNAIQSYYGWAFQIDFKPFRPGEEVVIKFSKKINIVLADL